MARVYSKYIKMVVKGAIDAYVTGNEFYALVDAQNAVSSIEKEIARLKTFKRGTSELLKESAARLVQARHKLETIQGLMNRETCQYSKNGIYYTHTLAELICRELYSRGDYVPQSQIEAWLTA